MGEAIAFRGNNVRSAAAPVRPDLRWLVCAALTASGLAAYAFALFLFASGLWTFLGAAG